MNPATAPTVQALRGALTQRLATLHVRDAQVEIDGVGEHVEVSVAATPDATVLAQVPRRGGLIRVTLDTTSHHLQPQERLADGPYTAAAAMADAIAYVLTATYLGRKHTTRRALVAG